MSELNAAALRRTNALIERYGLHDATAILPVPILQVARDEGWLVYYHSDMGSCIAMAFVVGGVRLMYINANLTRATQRVGIAHEMGHVLAGHTLSADVFMPHGRDHEGLRNTNAQQEHEAKLIAAMLLIPDALRGALLSVEDVAGRCGVPTGMVRHSRGVGTDTLVMMATGE